MRVLIISPTPTHPTNAGNRVRIVKLIEMLRNRGFHVHFLYVSLEGEAHAEMKAYFGEHLTVFRSKPLLKRFISNRLRAIFWNAGLSFLLPSAWYRYGIDDWYPNGLQKTCIDLSQRFNFDLVMCEYVFMSKALSYFSNSFKVIDAHDRLGNRDEMFTQVGLMPEWFSCTESQEAIGLKRAQLILALQDHERDYFLRIGGVKTMTLGIPFEFTPVEGPSKFTLGFFASDNRINQQALKELLSANWPVLRNEFPNLELVIAGGISKFVQPTDGVRVLGRVKTTAEAYAQMNAVINPMMIGTGLKIKSLEAIAHGKWLLSAPAGVEGLEVDQLAIHVFHSREDLIHQLKRVINLHSAHTAIEACRTYLESYNTKQAMAEKQLVDFVVSGG